MSGHDGLTDDRRADGFAKGILFARDPRAIADAPLLPHGLACGKLKLGSFKLTIRRDRH